MSNSRRHSKIAVVSAGIIAVATCISAMTATAEARPVVSSKIKYYNVSGRTAAELHRKMTVPGFTIGGHKAYANISASFDAKGNVSQGKYCKLKKYQIKLKFIITLPRLKNAGNLPKSVRAKFKKFQNFSHRHELKHQSIWTQCARQIERKVHAIRVKSCNSFDNVAQRIIQQGWKKCAAKHDAFDARESRRVTKQPFIRSAAKEARQTPKKPPINTYNSQTRYSAPAQRFGLGAANR